MPAALAVMPAAERLREPLALQFWACQDAVPSAAVTCLRTRGVVLEREAVAAPEKRLAVADLFRLTVPLVML